MKDRRTGVVRIAKTFILVLLLSALLVSVAYAATGNTGIFKDTVGHWASSSIQRLASLGILGGYSDDTFKPNGQVTRAQLAAVIDRTLGAIKYENKATTETITKGGLIYDSWAKATGTTAPANDNPLWGLQTVNKRSGYDTWRCKECHGWDYKGKGGVYGTGSHATGFPGVYRAAATMSKAELVEVLKGSTDYRHDFSSFIGKEDLEALAAFLKEGLINETSYINYSSKKPVSANLDSGKQKFDTSCASCHGIDGKQLNFGSVEKPEYVKEIALNPWEFTHKVRFGHPGSTMPNASQLGWTIQDAMDVLGYAQTLQ